MCILIQSWISPPTVFRHWIFSGLYLSDEISNIPGLYCMPTAPLSAWFGNIKPIASISEESAPCARICNVLEAISISLLLQCCSSRCTRWKLVTPEALCWGILEEEACQCFHRHRNRLCQKGIFFVCCAQTYLTEAVQKEDDSCQSQVCSSVGGKGLQFLVPPEISLFQISCLWGLGYQSWQHTGEGVSCWRPATAGKFRAQQ